MTTPSQENAQEHALAREELRWIERLDAAYRPEPMSPLERQRFEHRVRRAIGQEDRTRPQPLVRGSARRGRTLVAAIFASAMLCGGVALFWAGLLHSPSSDPAATSQVVTSLSWQAEESWERQVLQPRELDSYADDDLGIPLPADYAAIESAFLESDES